MRALALGVFVATVFAGCGDNAKSCGEGTVLANGECVPKPSQDLICGDGTVRDELTNECVPDPSVCGGGTVLIDGHCVDPTSDLTIDVEEGPEPNGFEPGATPAGTIILKDTGSTIVHGCIKPLDNNNPDLDVFLVTTTGPTLIKMTSDGVEGLAGGFLVLGDDARLGTWFRLGLNLNTDTSKRELFLPVAGQYEIAMADSRTLLPITTSGTIIPGAGFPAAGNPDGTSCYFATITKEPFPSAENLDLATGATGTIGEDLKFFTSTFPTGLVALHAVIDPEDIDNDGFPDIDSRAASSLILVNNDQLRQINDAGGGFVPADAPDSEMLFAGIKGGDSTLVILDYVWNIAAFPADFAIDVNAATTSQALATDGTVVTATSNGQVFVVPDAPPDFTKLNLFHFDVAAANEIDGIDITFSKPVSAVLIDQETLFAAPFTANNPARTFTNYRGALRLQTPGRYYFALIAPNDPIGTTFTVTSTIAPLTPTPVGGPGAETGPIDVNAFRSNVLTYNAGTLEPWQIFDATTTGTVGKLSLEMFDPTVTTPRQPGFAFGALDPMSIVDTAQPTNNIKPPDSTPIFNAELAADGSTPVDRILLNPSAQLPLATTNFLIHAAPVFGTSGTGTFTLDIEVPAVDDFGGAVLPPGAASRSGQITNVSPPQQFLFKAVPGDLVTITVDNPSATTLDFVLDTLNVDATVAKTVDNSSTPGTPEITSFVMPLGGFVAFDVRGGVGGSLGDYRVTLQITHSGYAIASGPTTFSNACIGGTGVALVDDGSGFGGQDEGLSAAITPPAGFEQFGATAGDFRVSSNGFLTFSLGNTSSQSVHGPLGGDIDIAPFWTDLENVVVCKKTVGTKLVIQWTGDDFSIPPGPPIANVQFQAILDGSDSSIEFVYGPAQLVNGATGGGATVGLDDLPGDQTLQLGLDQPIITRNMSIKLTPN